MPPSPKRDWYMVLCFGSTDFRTRASVNLGLRGLEIAFVLDLGIKGLRFRDFWISEIRGLPSDPKSAPKRPIRQRRICPTWVGSIARFWRQAQVAQNKKQTLSPWKSDTPFSADMPCSSDLPMVHKARHRSPNQWNYWVRGQGVTLQR